MQDALEISPILSHPNSMMQTRLPSLLDLFRRVGSLIHRESFVTLRTLFDRWDPLLYFRIQSVRPPHRWTVRIWLLFPSSISPLRAVELSTVERQWLVALHNYRTELVIACVRIYVEFFIEIFQHLLVIGINTLELLLASY